MQQDTKQVQPDVFDSKKPIPDRKTIQVGDFVMTSLGSHSWSETKVAKLLFETMASKKQKLPSSIELADGQKLKWIHQQNAFCRRESWGERKFWSIRGIRYTPFSAEQIQDMREREYYHNMHT